MTPSRVVTTISSEAKVLSLYLGIQAVFQIAHFMGERVPSSLGVGVALSAAAAWLWSVGTGIRNHKRWAHHAFELILWALVLLSLGFVTWVMFVLRRSGNQEFAEAQALARLILPIAAIPWLAALGFQIWRLRRPDVRGLLDEAKGRAR